MNDSTTPASLPAIRTDTSPIPVVTDDGEITVVHHTYPPLTPEALDRDWHETGDGEGWGYAPHNQQVYRALETIAGGILRNHDNPTITRRAAIVLLADPITEGTPLRCTGCSRAYRVGDPTPNWALAGREDGLCWPCTLTARPKPDKTIIVKPEAATPPRRRSRRATS